MALSGLGKVALNYKTVYPDELVYALVGHAARMTGLSAGERVRIQVCRR